MKAKRSYAKSKWYSETGNLLCVQELQHTDLTKEQLDKILARRCAQADAGFSPYLPSIELLYSTYARHKFLTQQ